MSNYKRYYNQFKNPVFITFVTKFRRNILIDYIDILRTSIKHSKEKYKYKIIAGIVLPDHCHILISTEKTFEIPHIIKDIKYNFTKNIPKECLNITLTDVERKRNEGGIWQRRYFDHIIRNEADFNKHLDYIHFNSVKHYDITPDNWEYSSFKKFVELGYYENDWCNKNDVNNINSLNYE